MSHFITSIQLLACIRVFVLSITATLKIRYSAFKSCRFSTGTEQKYPPNCGYTDLKTYHLFQWWIFQPAYAVRFWREFTVFRYKVPNIRPIHLCSRFPPAQVRRRSVPAHSDSHSPCECPEVHTVPPKRPELYPGPNPPAPRGSTHPDWTWTL